MHEILNQVDALLLINELALPLPFIFYSYSAISKHCSVFSIMASNLFIHGQIA